MSNEEKRKLFELCSVAQLNNKLSLGYIIIDYVKTLDDPRALATVERLEQEIAIIKEVLSNKKSVVSMKTLSLGSTVRSI